MLRKRQPKLPCGAYGSEPCLGPCQEKGASKRRSRKVLEECTGTTRGPVESE